ncbi:MAG: hypothetical protein R3C56_30910 [Pirellulaceae bacterium]
MAGKINWSIGPKSATCRAYLPSENRYRALRTGTIPKLEMSIHARAYLDMNCSSCHRPGGIGFTSGLDLRYEQDEPVRFGVYKAPVAAGRSAGNARFVIKPGDQRSQF